MELEIGSSSSHIFWKSGAFERVVCGHELDQVSKGTLRKSAKEKVITFLLSFIICQCGECPIDMLKIMYPSCHHPREKRNGESIPDSKPRGYNLMALDRHKVGLKDKISKTKSIVYNDPEDKSIDGLFFTIKWVGFCLSIELWLGWIERKDCPTAIGWPFGFNWLRTEMRVGIASEFPKWNRDI